MRDWQVKRRERTRQLIELGGLVVKAGLVELADDDRAALYGAFLTVAAKLREQDGAQSFNFVHVYDETVVHSVVPVEAPTTLEYTDAGEAQRRLAEAGIAPVSASRRSAPPTRPVPVLR